MALTDTKVRSVKSEEKEYSLVDGDGMFLLIHPNGSKYWRFRFRFGGKQHLMAFGVYPDVSLADARKKREEARKLVAAGIDPREHKRAVKEEQAKEIITFEKVAREWLVTNQKWSEDHANRVKKSLEDNIFPAIGTRNIAELGNRFGCRQSIPSRNIASLAGVRNTLPLLADDLAKWPRSSRFVSRHRPSLVDLNSLTRLPLHPPEDEDMTGHRVIFQGHLPTSRPTTSDCLVINNPESLSYLTSLPDPIY
ncbi:Prophage integrase IntA [Enterobacter cloacae]|nr:Prophage integrase IntA [Enterobacter cloacae]CAH5481909.1 Prophage integrase IntA [Enterobacter cloacae]